MPPTGTHWPRGDLLGDALEQLGLRLLDPGVLLRPASRRTGTRGSRPSAHAPRRTCGRTCARVSRIGHSQAVSMWAWPMAIDAVAGRARPGRSSRAARAIARGGGDVGERSSAPFERAQHLHPARVVERQRAHHAVEHLEVVGERLGVGVDDDELGPAEAVERRVAGGVERAQRRRAELGERRVRRRLEQQRHVAGRRRRGGSSCAAGGCPAAGVTTCRRRRARRRSPSHWKPAAFGWKPRSITASTRRPAHRRGACPSNRNQVVPHGAPHGLPTVERFEVIEVGAGGDRQRTAVGVDEREHALPQLTLDALLDQVPVVVHTARHY